MDGYSFGEIIVLPFSYSDLQSAKRRPALVLLDSGDEDILVARITSKKNDTPFDISLQNWNEVGLLVPSYVRLHKLLTVEKAYIIKNLGKLDNADLNEIREIFRKII